MTAAAADLTAMLLERMRHAKAEPDLPWPSEPPPTHKLSDEYTVNHPDGSGPISRALNEDDDTYASRVRYVYDLWGRKVAGAAPKDPGTLGTRTANELRWGAAPVPLVPPFLATEEATILYGPGGVGKGTIACYLAAEIITRDPAAIVLIVDYEGHESEWGSRLAGLGMVNEPGNRIHYVAPYSKAWTATRGDMLAVAERIAAEAVKIGATFLIVDSYTTATDGSEAMGGAAGAQLYYRALSIIGLPSLTLAHVTGNADKWPARPFGSVFVHNLGRETWAAERVGGTDIETWDPALRRVFTIVLELRQRKVNQGTGHPPEIVTIEHYADGTLRVTSATKKAKVGDLVAAVLSQTPNLTVAQIIKAVKEDTGEVVKDQPVSDALGRGGRFAHDEGRPRKWSLSSSGG